MDWNRIALYIEENLGQEISIKKIAGIAGYSEYYFARCFKEYMGISVKEYVQRRRLIKASEEIVKGKKIIDVAIQYGWQSHSGFTRAFRKEFDFHPSLLKVLGEKNFNHVFLEKTEIGMQKEELFVLLKRKMKSRFLETAYRESCKVYEGKKRYSGEEYVTHPLNVAILLTELEAEENVVLAGMFCDAKRKGNLSIEKLENNLPKESIQIIRLLCLDEMQVKDERVLLIKLAERLHNMRTLEYMNAELRTKKAKETIKIFVPLVQNIANKKLMNELNDLSMKYYRE